MSDTMSPYTELIAAITWTENGGVQPLHEVVDRDKHAALVDDMAANGWQGPPIVVEGEQAYTGAHRLAAVRTLWNEHGVRVGVPRVDIAELCDTFGLNWHDRLAEHDYLGGAYQAAADLRFALPREVVDHLGFDVDGAL